MSGLVCIFRFFVVEATGIEAVLADGDGGDGIAIPVLGSDYLGHLVPLRGRHVGLIGARRNCSSERGEKGDGEMLHYNAFYVPLSALLFDKHILRLFHGRMGIAISIFCRGRKHKKADRSHWYTFSVRGAP